MTPKKILRSTLVALVALTLIAAPAAAAAPDRDGETPRWTWMADLGDLIDRVSGLLFGERAGKSEDRDPRTTDINSISGENDGGSGWDPNG